jgi:hypothetical protein
LDANRISVPSAAHDGSQSLAGLIVTRVTFDPSASIA